MADYSFVQSLGGTKRGAVAAGSGAADVVVSAKPGRICRLVVTTAGTAALELHNHASTSSSTTLVWKSAATPAVGDIITLDLPVSAGIVAKQANGSAAVTVYYTEDELTALGADNAQPVSTGGQLLSFHAAGASGAGAASSVPGRLCKISVLSSGSAATLIYDNSSAAGTLLYTIKASPTVGDVIDVQAPVVTGIYVAGATNTSSIAVTYSKNTPYGR